MPEDLHAVPQRLGYARRRAWPVRIGSLTIGGDAPVAVQSMCTTPTQDVAATVAQAIRLAEAGCAIVRIAAPGLKDAQALREIRARFSAAGFAAVPLVADIHFMPAAALEAVEHVEKVRINPGNYADKKRFAIREYSDAEYAEELERVAERFRPLVRRAKELGRALRIGVNHGSLSDRIMNRYGDTPEGMVESALEFLRVAEDEGFRDLVISMKASNPKVMVQANRLLVARLAQRGTPYPLHLGVTEAGDGEDGRVKSAAGIGALLEDGIGDTIRVSLSEPPEREIPVAQALVARYAAWRARPPLPGAAAEAIDPYRYQRRASEIVSIAGVSVGGGRAPLVLAPAGAAAGQPAPDLVVEDAAAPRPGPAGPPAALTIARAAPVSGAQCLLLDLDPEDPLGSVRRALAAQPEPCLIGIGDPGALDETRAYRLLAAELAAHAAAGGPRHPLCLALLRVRDELAAAAIAGGLLIDGYGDALYLPAVADPRRLAFTILQAVKARITRADYVACPSCGRTQFDLFEVTQHIREATSHLEGVSIAIMGCIVNGPGEMADADFGFVGSGPGKIDLYRGKEVVRRNLPFAEARAALIQLIKDSGRWRDPPS
ncbi:MAG: (E)-4-hydroxy-3-methylbut-2-enyl-diphosphate synthase [Planctomycetes bacterium]|nr:(E)-4-hydroxy-3-methylbut-2-enyl-diphosphate synthase [Planctomycetota bacterium]